MPANKTTLTKRVLPEGMRLFVILLKDHRGQEKVIRVPALSPATVMNEVAEWARENVSSIWWTEDGVRHQVLVRGGVPSDEEVPHDEIVPPSFSIQPDS